MIRPIAIALMIAGTLSVALAATGTVQVDWLGGTPPGTTSHATWGVPWPKGEVPAGTSMRLTGADGSRVEMATWPLAHWPDGTLKWTGHAIVAAAGLKGPFTITTGPDPAASSAPRREIEYAEDDAGIVIDTGRVRARIAKQGDAIIDSLSIGRRIVGREGRLTAVREDRSEYASAGILREERYVGRTRKVALEQADPLRAVVKVEGVHRLESGGREWLPFTVRLSFHAGSADVGIVHSFVFDGEAGTDFIKGLGLSFAVPFEEELHNRHIRLVGDGGGVWAQPVRMLPGYREQAGPQIRELYASHLAGQRVPDLADLTPTARDALLTVPVWGDAKLVQLGPNGWSIHKRTSPGSSWLHYTDGRRAAGLAVLGDVSGGLAIGLKDFWQKHPSALEILDGAAEVGQIRAWFWSPEAPAMDLRHYSTRPHGLPINYEDWKPGWSTPVGIANTHELTLRAFAAIPANAELVELAQVAAAPPRLVAAPEYYHRLQVFGHWSLPDRSTPTLRWIEDQVQGFVDYYRKQVEERSWYGFWDYGDIMHNYDFGRHDWRYDVGGWAWVNTELMPDMLLWYSFLRTGRADLFRFAEAMTRHTSEVDVHHLGPFAPLGSRHNVNHWGDGAKQPRISHAGLKRFLYFLSGGDGRLGDLLREQVEADLTYAYLEQFNGSHYVPTADGGYRLSERAGGAALRPEEFGSYPTAQDRGPLTDFGIDWMCYALNWTTEWERGGDASWRPRLEAAMRTMAAEAGEGGRLRARHFDMLFGGPENMWEMERMYDIPAFWAAWANTCEAVGRQAGGNQMTGPRLLAYAAMKKKDAELGRLAWEKLIGSGLPSRAEPRGVSGAGLVKDATDPAFLGASVGWQQHGVASVHWALNAIETLEMAKPWLRDWEAEYLREP